VAHTCNPSTQETEAGGLQVQGHLGIDTSILSQKKKRKIWALNELFCYIILADEIQVTTFTLNNLE
jgi:hypothetical protein